MMAKLTRIERRWAHAVCETIYPSAAEGGALPLGVGEMNLDGFLDETLANVPPEPAIGLRLAFFLIAFAPLFVIGRFAMFPSLSRADRERVLKAMSASSSYGVRSTVIAVKAVLSLFYCGDAVVRPRIWGAPLAALEAAPVPGLAQLRTRKDTHEAKGGAHEHQLA